MKKLSHIFLVGILVSMSIVVSTGIVYAQQSGAQTSTSSSATSTTSRSTTGAGGSQNTTDFVPLAPIPGLTDQQTVNNELNDTSKSSFANFFNNLYKYLIGLAAILAVIEIMIGGFQISLQQSNISKQIEARGRITRAVLGLIIVLAPVMVFSIINKSILNLSVDLPTLNTAAPITTTTAPTGQATNIAGCKSNPGPVANSVIVNCTSNTQSNAKSNAEQYITTNCPKSDYTSVFASGKTQDGQYSSEAYCTPIVKIGVLESKLNTSFLGTTWDQDNYVDISYYGTDSEFPKTCDSGTAPVGSWRLWRVGASDMTPLYDSFLKSTLGAGAINDGWKPAQQIDSSILNLIINTGPIQTAINNTYNDAIRSDEESEACPTGVPQATDCDDVTNGNFGSAPLTTDPNAKSYDKAIAVEKQLCNSSEHYISFQCVQADYYCQYTP